jgi:protein TonB
MAQRSATRPGLANAFWGWTVAIAGSIVLNIALFGLMPGLIQRLPASQDKLEELKQVQVIRVKKQETVQRKKKPPTIQKTEPVKQVKQAPQAQLLPRTAALKPHLDFKLNPKLPTAPMDLVMPSLENFSMQGPSLKDVYEIDELDTGLMALVKIPPMYPGPARRRGIEGFVTVEFRVSPEGIVEDIAIITAEPADIFNLAVKNCVTAWKFKPPTIEGIPVAARARTTIHFKLE